MHFGRRVDNMNLCCHLIPIQNLLVPSLYKIGYGLTHTNAAESKIVPLGLDTFLVFYKPYNMEEAYDYTDLSLQKHW